MLRDVNIRVFVDGSWWQAWAGGIGYVLTDDGELVRYHTTIHLYVHVVLYILA